MDLKVYALLNEKIKELAGGGLTRAEVEKIVTDEVAKIVAGAPEDFDTLKEMSDWILNHEESAASMNSAIQTNANDISALDTNKVDKVDGKSLVSDTEIARLAKVTNYDDSGIKADIQTNADNINTNKTNISTLAKHMTGDLTDSDFQEDSTVAMTKTVPSGMGDYAAIKVIGGKTVKDEENQVLKNAVVESVVSTSADGTTETTLLLPDALKNLPDYGVGIDPEHCNWIDFENMVYHHDYTLADLTGKSWTSDGNGVFHTSYPTNAKVKAYGICNNYTVDYNYNTPQDVGDMIVRDPTYNVMYVKVKSGTSPDTTGTLLYYELADDKKELIDISDILHPIGCESGGTITFSNEHNLDMPNTVVYKKEVSLS